MTVYFSADHHFHHSAILGYCARPFADVDTMNEAMIARWNARVTPADTVYHLGDFAMGPRELLAPTRARLNGRVVLVLGNHDRSRNAMLAAGFDEVVRDAFVTVDGVSLYLSHKPRPDFLDASAEYLLHGHVHGEYVRRGRLINVGVDVREFEPKTLGEILPWPGTQ